MLGLRFTLSRHNSVQKFWNIFLTIFLIFTDFYNGKIILSPTVLQSEDFIIPGDVYKGSSLGKNKFN